MIETIFAPEGRIMSKANEKEDKLSLAGFGSFSPTKRVPRSGRNPQTGKPINIAAGHVQV